MNVKIAEIEITTDERLYGKLIKSIENMGYVVVQDGISGTRYIIARESEE